MIMHMCICAHTCGFVRPFDASGCECLGKDKCKCQDEEGWRDSKTGDSCRQWASSDCSRLRTSPSCGAGECFCVNNHTKTAFSGMGRDQCKDANTCPGKGANCSMPCVCEDDETWRDTLPRDAKDKYYPQVGCAQWAGLDCSRRTGTSLRRMFFHEYAFTRHMHVHCRTHVA